LAAAFLHFRKGYEVIDRQLITKAQAVQLSELPLRTFERRVRSGEITIYRDGRDRRKRLVSLEDVQRIRQPIPLGSNRHEDGSTAA
jgi:hypothetical protein